MCTKSAVILTVRLIDFTKASFKKLQQAIHIYILIKYSDNTHYKTHCVAPLKLYSFCTKHPVL